MKERKPRCATPRAHIILPLALHRGVQGFIPLALLVRFQDFPLRRLSVLSEALRSVLRDSMGCSGV
jgi:hypothetical protein